MTVPLKKAYEETIKRNLGENEAKILFDFVNSSIIKGDYYTRVPICGSHIRMDALCIKGTETKYPISILGKLKKLRRHLLSLRGVNGWILEIKEGLNFEALGQILVDRFFFPREYPNITIDGYGMLCRSGDKAIELVCKHYGVKVFEVPL